MMGSGSSVVIVSLVMLTLLAALMSGVELNRFRTQGRQAHFYYGAGLGIVSATMLLEIIFYSGTINSIALGGYLFLVALLVGVLSLGSAEEGLPGAYRSAWRVYVASMAAIVAITCFWQPAPASIVVNGIVTGVPPFGIVVASALLTIPAALLMAGLALHDAVRFRALRLGLIAAGILVLAVAGTLYIVSIPVTLYYAEFVGVILLFFGFGGIRPGITTYPRSIGWPKAI